MLEPVFYSIYLKWSEKYDIYKCLDIVRNLTLVSSDYYIYGNFTLEKSDVLGAMT